jgi:hypothetical protein
MASKERAPVSRASSPQSVPPPRDVPPTRSKVRGEVTLRMLTPEPMLTRR